VRWASCIKARDPLIGPLVALKTINSNLVDRPDLLERFYQEAQSAGKLQHPNIVTIFDLGQERGTPFIAMEYREGESLRKNDPWPEGIAFCPKGRLHCAHLSGARTGGPHPATVDALELSGNTGAKKTGFEHWR
jgi:hypothetical protein